MDEIRDMLKVFTSTTSHARAANLEAVSKAFDEAKVALVVEGRRSFREAQSSLKVEEEKYLMQVQTIQRELESEMEAARKDRETAVAALHGQLTAFTNVLNQEKSRLQAQKAGWETSAGEDLESSLAEVSSLLQKFLAAQAEGYVSRDAEVAVPILLEAEKAGNVMQSELSKLESELKVARSVSRSVKKRGAAGGGEGRAGGGGSAAGKNAEGRGTAASLLGGNGADDYAAGAGAGSAASGSSEAVLAAAGDWGAFPGQEEQEEGERSSSSSSKGRSRAGGASRASAGRAAAAGGGRSRVKAGEDEEEDDSRMQLESSQLSALDASGNGSPLEESGPVSTGRGHKAGDAFTFNF